MNDFGRVCYKTRVFERTFEDTVQNTPVMRFIKTQINAMGVFPVKFYEVGGETYVYCTNGNIKKKVDDVFVSTGFASTVMPLIAPIIKNGVKTVIFISDVTASVDGESVTGVPYGTSCEYLAGRLFISDGDTIHYSGEFDFTDFNVGLGFGGFMKVDKADGEILFLSGDSGKLTVVCEHAIYTVTPYGEEYEFKMEKVSATVMNIAKGTVCKIGNRIYFLNDKRLYYYSDGKLKKANDAMINYTTTIDYGTVGSRKELYVLPMNLGNNVYVYTYDTVRDCATFQLLSGYMVAGGYATKNGDAYLYEMTALSDNRTIIPEYSGEYDFGSCRKKSVCRLEAHIRGSADVVITGEGFFRATLTEKCNEVTCFVHGKSFNINFENTSQNFKLYRLTVHYIIYGE